VRQVFALFDEYQSKENAKHTLRATRENARQGLWNGSKAPYGYAVVAAEQRGAKTKKRLAIDAVEAEIVRLIFRLFREGDGSSGPMGVKSVTSWLNAHGHRTRNGARRGTGQLHKILTGTSDKGEHRINRKVWKTRKAKPEADHISVAIDSVIDAATFDAVQAMLRARNPKALPPRVVTGPILLTGIATCASCSGGMTLRTGKTGRYRYYTCSTCARAGDRTARRPAPDAGAGRQPARRTHGSAVGTRRRSLRAPERSQGKANRRGKPPRLPLRRHRKWRRRPDRSNLEGPRCLCEN
jgi:site-specific DNA recombinase